jgi:hypothetical protein
MMRESPLGWLAALFAAVMLAGSGAGAVPATATMATLCNGGSAKLPGQPGQPECDKACHAACGRRKARP